MCFRACACVCVCVCVCVRVCVGVCVTHEEGFIAIRKALDTRIYRKFSTDSLIEKIEYI